MCGPTYTTNNKRLRIANNINKQSEEDAIKEKAAREKRIEEGVAKRTKEMLAQKKKNGK